MRDPIGPVPTPRIRIVRKALVVPATDAAPTAHGVFDRRGTYLPMSRVFQSNRQLSPEPQHAPAQDTLAGTYLYGGLARDHFGHFIVESTTRLWALDQIEETPKAIVYTRLPASGKPQFNRRMGAFHKKLCGSVPALILDSPTEVERLILPSQGFGHGRWINGTTEYRTFVKSRLEDIPPQGAEKLYISRAKYTEAGRTVDQEAAIETMMEDAGYHVFQPEKFGIDAQTSAFKAAKLIVGGDGSAFHFAPFVMQQGAKAAVFLRRHRPDVLRLLGKQILAFTGTEPTLIDPRAGTAVEPGAHVTLDIDILRTELTQAGFL